MSWKLHYTRPNLFIQSRIFHKIKIREILKCDKWQLNLQKQPNLKVFLEEFIFSKSEL